MKGMIAFVLVALATFVAGGVLHAADGDLAAIPELHARVTDLVGALPPQRREQIEQRLAALEQRKGAQVAVLLVPSTAPEPIEAYATRVFDAWKLGRKGVDDGVLVVVAKNDRRTRIEVGYGLEGAIPDAAAKRVMHDYMSPKFAAGDFAGGVDAGVDWLTKLIDGEPLPTAPVALSSHRGGVTINADDEPWWSPLQFVIGIMFGAFLAVLLILFFGNRTLYLFSLGRLPERARPYAFGFINAIPIAILMRHPMAALAAFATGGSLASLIGLGKPPQRGGGFRGGGGGGGYSGGSSGGSSGGGGGGGFSGGGGSSGGGGASDSW